MTKCFASADIDTAKMTDKDCKTESDIKICLCDTDNCNNPTGAAGSISEWLVQIFTAIVFSYGFHFTSNNIHRLLHIDVAIFYRLVSAACYRLVSD